jgi:integrase
MAERAPRGALVVAVMRDGTPVWEGKWRHPATGDQIKRRIGRAWLRERPKAVALGRGDERWKARWTRRAGSTAAGWFTERDATRRMEELIAESLAVRAEPVDGPLLFDDAAAAWLHERRTVRGIKATTLADYMLMLRYPDDAPVRGKAPRARLMRAFAGLELAALTADDVRSFLEEMDDDPTVGARSVNKHRAVLHGIFRLAVERGQLADNPVAKVAKRAEADPAEIITYTPAQVVDIARRLERGEHRRTRMPADGAHARAEHAAWRALENQQDAVAVLLAAFCGLRLGELLALRWRDVLWTSERLHVQRSYAQGVETSTKGRRGRVVPLSEQAAQALARLSQREHFTKAGDLVLCTATGEHVDGSALRRRYKAARDAAIRDAPDMPALRFHDLRHCFGTMAAAGFDLVNVQAMMGHRDLSTTQRYLHARPAVEDAAKLSRLISAGLGADDAPADATPAASARRRG